ncbi:MAG: CDP-diacylglycerol--serine O-phosphatidyltransferase, partial [Frankiales bacterium]|nr:CDP-diacylglycerol--serine O-phosphatidyltransferase [Frankiales bacterium]
MRQHVQPANLVTSTSLVLGFLALLCAPQRPALATLLVLVAAVLDVVDGALARRTGGDRTFGAQLDSLTDLLCFCVVPAFTLHHAVGGGVAVPAACAFVVAGAWRLARFPLVQQQGSFVGLPTPAGGGLLMLLATWAPGPVAVLGAVLLAGLMVSALRIPTVLAAAALVRPAHRAHTGR